MKATASNAERRVAALRIAGARGRRSIKRGDAPADKKGRGRGKSYVCGSEEHFAHKHCDLCRSLEHRSCDCEKRGAEKGAMLTKINVPANDAMGLVAATTGAGHGDGKKKGDLDSGALFHIFHTQA